MTCPKCGTKNLVTKDDLAYFACGYRRGGYGKDSECGDFITKKETSEGSCICSTNQLFYGGCICGQFVREQALKAKGGYIFVCLIFGPIISTWF